MNENIVSGRYLIVAFLLLAFIVPTSVQSQYSANETFNRILLTGTNQGFHGNSTLADQDLDSDNDGIPDAVECQETTSSTNFYIGDNGGKDGGDETYTSNSNQVVTKRIIIDFKTVDNAVRVKLNGVALSTGGYLVPPNTSNGIMQLQEANLLSGQDMLTFSSDGTAAYFDQPWWPNNNNLPRLRIIIEDGSITLLGTRYRGSSSLTPVYLRYGNLNLSAASFNGIDPDEVNIYIPDADVWPDNAEGDVTFEYQTDSDNDGIPNCEDTDSDNDGCPDADEKDTSGGIGNSQKATQIDITQQPQDQTVCIDENVEFKTKVTATNTTVFNGGNPNYTDPSATTEDVNYQWQKYNATTSDWEDISGESGTVPSDTEISLDLGTQSNTDNNGAKYRVKLTSASMSCPKYSDEATLTVNNLPNNTGSNGFKGKIICFETTAKLTYNADNTDFVAPHTIVYENEDTGIQYTQTITTASPFQFEPGDTPTAVGTHNYKLLSITDGNGCVRTTGFGKDEADIIIREKPENLLTVSLDKNETCKDDTNPILTFANSDTKKIKVTYQINGGSEQTIDVNGNSQNTINIPTNTVGVFNYNIIKVSYKGNPKCEDIIDIKHCVAVFPQNNVAPTVNTGTGANVMVTPPQTYTDFTIEYNFGDGAGWQAQNTKTLVSKCDGYDIQTRYKLSGSCNGADTTMDCATSPTTNRIVDVEKPTFTKPTDVSLCVNNIINANYTETTNGDVNTPPDYYEFPTNYTDLDITNINDNCCTTGNTIEWTITPNNGQSISGTGQPSASLAGKKLWLDVATSNPKSSYTEKQYTITYKVTDCNGNISDEKSTTITIKPRPKITKVN